MDRKQIALNVELLPLLEQMASDPDLPLWVELLPAGDEVEGRDGRKWKKSDAGAIVQAFEERGADLPIDVEHSTELKAPEGEPAPAMGWIKKLELRGEGDEVWGLVEWVGEGRWLVREKSYRYLSPVFVYDKESGEILELLSAGLTNQPNLKLTALNRAQNQPEGNDDMALSKAMCQALGIAEDADEATALTAIEQLKTDKATALNRAESPSLEKFVPRADYDAAMNRATTAEQTLADRDQADQDTKIEIAVNAAIEAGKIAPSSKEYHIAACRAEGGLEQFEQFVESAPVIANPSGLDDNPPNAGVALNAEEKQAADLMGISHEEFAKAKKEEEQQG